MDFENTSMTEEKKWQVRRFRHLMNYGIKDELVEEELSRSDIVDSIHTAVASSDSLNEITRPKESAIKVIYHVLISFITGKTRSTNDKSFQSVTNPLTLPISPNSFP